MFLQYWQLPVVLCLHTLQSRERETIISSPCFDDNDDDDNDNDDNDDDDNDDYDDDDDDDDDW